MTSTAVNGDIVMQNINSGIEVVFEDDIKYHEVQICTTNDDSYETDEEFFLRLTPTPDDDDAVHIGSPDTATVVIADDGDTRK